MKHDSNVNARQLPAPPPTLTHGRLGALRSGGRRLLITIDMRVAPDITAEFPKEAPTFNDFNTLELPLEFIAICHV